VIYFVNFSLRVSRISFQSPWSVRLRRGAQPMQCLESSWLFACVSLHAFWGKEGGGAQHTHLADQKYDNQGLLKCGLNN
jgi:hypothetical protein